MNIEVVPFATGFGAEIRGVDLKGPLEGEVRSAVEEAFKEHHVLAFKSQEGLPPDRVVNASRLFGDELEPHVFHQYHHPDTDLILVLSNRIKGEKPAGLADAGSFWHSDVSYKPEPAKATLLYAVEVPDVGGDTLFCNLTAAYDGLSDGMKKKLDGLMAWHDYAKARPEMFMDGKVARVPECLHPVIRTNPLSGRKAIYVNPAYTTRIDGMEKAESDALLDEIFEHCLQDEYRMTYKWHAGDMVVWDNAAVMHAATTKGLDPAKHRTLWRTIICGGPTH